MEDLVGFEPTIRELQSHALPLGYRPIDLLIITNNLIIFNIFYDFFDTMCLFLYNVVGDYMKYFHTTIPFILGKGDRIC